MSNQARVLCSKAASHCPSHTLADETKGDCINITKPPHQSTEKMLTRDDVQAQQALVRAHSVSDRTAVCPGVFGTGVFHRYNRGRHFYGKKEGVREQNPFLE